MSAPTAEDRPSATGPAAAAPEIFISAGEISGDLHGGKLLTALRRLCPGLRAFGIGGTKLEDAGLESTAGIDRLSLVGITEVLPRLYSLFQLLSETRRLLARRRPRAVILVDSPDFNLQLARHAHSLGIKVIYFIGPTVWAWRRRRIRLVREAVDLMITILPFEEDLYRRHGVRATYVGHPLVDDSRPTTASEEFIADLGLQQTGDLIAILPGSRRNEVRRLLPALIGAGKILARRRPSTRFLFPAASPELFDLIRAETDKALPGGTVVQGRAADCLAAARAAVVTSGTATLEASLQGTPFLTVYRLSPLSYLVGRLLVRTPWISLPNLLLQEEVVRELIQGACRPERIASEAERLLDDGTSLRMKRQFAIMREKLGPGGAVERAARAIAVETGLVSRLEQ